MYQAKRILVTSALPYANGPLHIGHLSGAYLPADIYVRFQRLMDREILYVCGSDEHGAAITLRAAQEGIEPQEIIDKYHGMFQEAFEGMDISFDIYHRTSSDLHRETSQEFFRALAAEDVFDKRESEQYYDEEADKFLADRYIKGTCPRCGHPDAYGDQCENCGSTLSPDELIDAVSAISGATPVKRKTTHWYLPLDRYEKWLGEWIERGTIDGREHHDASQWKNHVLGQCKSWIEGGLHARAMTRDLNWGVPVPPELEGSEGKKLYVWMDAPIGYISATKQWCIDHEQDWKDWWQSEDTGLVHFIGKDNIVFHCIIFPAILRAHGDYVLPQNVPANQFLNLEGEKLSTSRNWAIWVNDYVRDWSEHTDELRFYLAKNMPEQRDSDFAWKGFQDANNNELVNNLANFIHRVMVLSHKYYDGILPEINEDIDIAGPRTDDEYAFHDSELLFLFDQMHQYCAHVREYKLREALQDLLSISSYGNQLLQFNEPWKLIKEDPEKTKVVLHLAMQYVVALSVLMRPFLPRASDRLRDMLQVDRLSDSGELLRLLDHMAEGEHPMSSGHAIGEAKHLFSRIEDERIEAEMEKLKASQNDASISVPAVAIKPEINFDDFSKIDIRTATITAATTVPKADKLLQLKVDLGYEQRTILSGIAQHFDPVDLPGTEVLVVANLAPRKMRGVMSEGMILMAENEDGKLDFVSPREGWGKGYVVS